MLQSPRPAKSAAHLSKFGTLDCRSSGCLWTRILDNKFCKLAGFLPKFGGVGIKSANKEEEETFANNYYSYKRVALAPLRGGLGALRFAKSVLAFRVLSKRS